MRLPIPRFVRWAVVLAVIAASAVAVFQYRDTTQTQWGALGPSDRDLLVKVRQAGLWEIPISQQAQQQGTSPRVREVGGLLAAEHIDLDRQVRDVASQLGVLLPNEPTNQQQVWMTEIGNKSGADYDRTFVQRLRAAHGKVLPVAAEVRGSTQNELIRSLADTAVEFVSRHCEYLESTGLVDSAALPSPPVPDSGTPPGSVPAAIAAPAEAMADLHQHGDERQVSQVAQANTTNGAAVYVVALLYVGALLSIVGLFYLLGGADLLARQNRLQARQARHGPRVIPARPRHAAQRW